MRRVSLLVVLVLFFAFPALARADSPTHVVAYGETLYSIARAYGVSPADLAAANGITTDSWVYAGQRLVIPTYSDASNAAKSAPVSVAHASPGGFYLVRAGDTLSSVSRNFGVSVAAIAEANNIPPNGFLYTGWQLKIPRITNPPSQVNSTSVESDQPTNRQTDSTTSYIVVPGDTLYGIAIQYNVTIAALQVANNLGTPFVYAGQRLVIPGSASASASSSSAPAASASASTSNSSAPAASASTSTSSPRAPAASAALPNEVLARVEDVPVYRQEQTLTCEQSAASMATRGALTEAQIVAAMPRSDNPFEGIRGNTNYELFGGLTHYGTYAHGLQKGLAKLGRKSTTYYGQSYAQFKNSVLENLRAGRPVIWWTTWRESFQKPEWVEVSNGIKVPLIPYEHAVVIVEATEKGVTYHDPYDGTVRSTNWANHQRTSGYFNNMALVVY